MTPARLAALFAALLLSGCASRSAMKRLEAENARLKYGYADDVRHLLGERESLQREVLRLQGMLQSQVVNNEEILAAARAGEVEKARKLREKALSR